MTNTNLNRPLLRPKMLVKAAKIGLKSYIREKCLGIILNRNTLPPKGDAHDMLRQKEEELNNARKQNALSYNIQEHISVLTALLAELSLVKNVRNG